LLVVFALGSGWHAWLLVGADTVVIGLLCASEALSERSPSVAPV
jgi:hypothetical protein